MSIFTLLLTASIPVLVLFPREITITRAVVEPEVFPYVIARNYPASGAVKSSVDVVKDILEREGISFTEASKIIHCESRWNPNAVNRKNKNGSVDKGLWQINSIHGLPDDVVFDPVKSTEFAVKLYKKFGWQPWSCKI